jgi:hypothetical protein
MHRRRRIIRRRVLETVCILLSLLMAVLWARSHWISDTFGLSPEITVATCRGEIIVSVIKPGWNFSVYRGYGSEQLPDPDGAWNPRRAARRTWNLWVAHAESFPGLEMTVIRIWPIFAVVALALVLIVNRDIRDQRRAAQDACHVCGYDLRSSPDRRPECGEPRSDANSSAPTSPRQ